MKRATGHPELLPVVLARKEGDRRVTQHTPQEFHTGLLPKQHNCLADVLEGAAKNPEQFDEPDDDALDEMAKLLGEDE